MTNWTGYLLVKGRSRETEEEQDAETILETVVEHLRDTINTNYNEVHVSILNEGVEEE